MKFFCDVQGDVAVLTGEDARHLTRSLRVRLGECIVVVVCDGKGTDYVCSVSAINADAVELTVQERRPSAAELAYSLVLYQCMPKGEKWDFILQKSVELGATKIVPVMSQSCVTRLTPGDFEKKRDRYERIILSAAKQSGRGKIPLGATKIVPVMSQSCVTRLTPGDFEKKRDRYERIILSAAKQSGRGKIPTLGELIGIKQAFDELAEQDFAIFCYENAEIPLGTAVQTAKNPSSVGVLIGAEGGFCGSEVEYAKGKGLLAYSLGGRILRAETAAVAVLSAVSIIL